MKCHKLSKILILTGLVCAGATWSQAQTVVPGTYKSITIDGSFADWGGVPVAYTAPAGPTNAIQYENVYLANDQTNLYIRFTLYSPRAAFQNSYDNIFIDADDNSGTGYYLDGIGSEMLIQWGGGYQEKNGKFNEGAINGLGWNIAGSPDSMDYEIAISLGATYGSDGTPVFTNGTIAVLLEGDNTGYVSTALVPPFGGLVYTLASPPAPLTTNLTLVDLATSSWEINAAGADLGTNWLDSGYDDTVAGWTTGDGLFGYTSHPGSYPGINTPLSSGANTYYFRTHFEWGSDPTDVAFVVTNYLSTGAVFYLNGAEVRRLCMPAGAIAYATAAGSTNPAAGRPEIFGIGGGFLQGGDNILEVEVHQTAISSADLVFGLSLTAAIQYPVLVVSTNLPVDQSVFAGQAVTFTSDVLGSGPLSYQWFFNATNAIAGANGATFTLPLVLTNNAGLYSLQVSNQFATVQTRSAALTVSNTAVAITTQPVSQIVLEGNPITFTVAVTGTPLISYQWSFANQPIVGATNASYTISPALPTNAGAYAVTISNPASSTNSLTARLTVLSDFLPPAITNISAGATGITVMFSKPVDATSATKLANYAVSGGITLGSAVETAPNQVLLTATAPLTVGTVYNLAIHGVMDLFGNVAAASGQFTRDITIDGSFDDWTGISPIYTSTGPSGNTGAADFAAIYVFNDANYYYFRVTLWSDIPPADGQFPYYVNMEFDTDNNAATGYGSIGSEMLIQSGYSYQEKNGGFNDGVGSINGLNWLCLPQSPGTNFEFQISMAATFPDNGQPVFTTNQVNFLFQGMTPSYVVENEAPLGGAISYVNILPPTVAPWPLGKLGLSALPGGQVAVLWNQPGRLQVSSSVRGGSWTNLPAATSPYVIPAASGDQYFRLTQ